MCVCGTRKANSLAFILFGLEQEVKAPVASDTNTHTHAQTDPHKIQQYTKVKVRLRRQNCWVISWNKTAVFFSHWYCIFRAFLQACTGWPLFYCVRLPVVTFWKPSVRPLIKLCSLAAAHLCRPSMCPSEGKHYLEGQFLNIYHMKTDKPTSIYFHYLLRPALRVAI